MGKIVLYGKIGRSMPLTLEACGNLGGDVEMVAIVKRLAEKHPRDTFVLIGRNSGENPQDVNMPANIVNPWTALWPRLRDELKAAGLRYPNMSAEDQVRMGDHFDRELLQYFVNADAIVAWVGQHGTSNSPLPGVADRSVLTKPQDSFALYASYFLRGINHWRDRNPHAREEIYLNADARNNLKLRDLKWPLFHPVLTQFNFENRIKHERYGDLRSPIDFHWNEVEDLGPVWRAPVRNVYSRLEINGLYPGTPFGDLLSFNRAWERRSRFGMFINEARAAGTVKPEMSRRVIVKNWVKPLIPDFMHGTWSKESLADMEMAIKPAPWSEYVPKLQSVRSTFTTPSSGSGWATAKPWEAFAVGTVCFFHPAYDSQDNILGDMPKELRKYLRVNTPGELKMKVQEMDTDKQWWSYIVEQQRRHFDKALADEQYMKMIEARIYGGNA